MKDKETDNSKVQVLSLPYMKGVSENIEQTIGPTKLKVVFKPLKTMRQTLMKVKNPVPAEIKKGVVPVYEIRDRLDTEEAYFRAQTGSEEV